MFKKQQLNWQGLKINPARSHEYPMLELSWAWEPTDRAGAWRFDPGTRSLSRVPSRNMA